MTLVTGLFNLHREDAGEGFKRPFEHYIIHFTNLLKSTKHINMVVYIEEKYRYLVDENRDSSNTIVRIYEIDQFKTDFAYFSEVNTIRVNPEWYSQAGWLQNSTQATMELYNPMVMSKLKWVYQESVANPFHDDYVYWIDAGLTSTVHGGYFYKDKILDKLPSYVKDTFLWISFPYKTENEIHGFSHDEMKQIASVPSIDYVCRGGFFGGHIQNMKLIYDIYDDLLSSSFKNGYMGTEESIFTLISYKYPHLFTNHFIESNGLVYKFFEDMKNINSPNKFMNEPKIDAYKSLIEYAFKNAENNISNITDDIINMEGMSGTKTRHFYNNLLNTSDARYLEIGTWKGSSVCAAMCNNKASVICIDNWSEFGGPKSEFLINFNKFKGENDATFIENDCYKVNVSKLPKFNIYMYDGNHTTENHYKALLHYYNCLDDIFIFIVDYWNYSDVRDGTKNCIKDLKLKVLYEKEIRLTWNNSHTEKPEAQDTWWNGIYVSILQKDSSFQPIQEVKVSTDTALYVLTFNSPNQFKTLIQSMNEYDTNLLKKTKKYLLDNSTNDSLNEYASLCKEYDFEHIKKDNLGICGGRQFIAEHFEKTGLEYCMFYEDDMTFADVKEMYCKNGFRRFIPDFYDKIHKIIKTEQFDFLKFNFTEFYGSNIHQWAWHNVPQHVRSELFPEAPEKKDGVEIPFLKYNNIKSYEGLPYASGEIYYCNWPQLITKDGNKKMFLDTTWAHPYEQTWMSHIYQETVKKNIKMGILLATPTEHDRFEHYEAKERKES